jgi:hypothetical protein
MNAERVTTAAVSHLSRLPRLHWSRVNALGSSLPVQAAVKAKRQWNAVEHMH